MSKSEPIRILYMEDNPGLARLFRKRLERAGYVVEVAYDGEEGLTMYESGCYDVLAVDQVMPVHEGLEVIRILASRGPLPPIIMVTGTGSEEIAVEAMKLGASDYIVKDVDGGYLDLLPTVIEQALSKHRLAEERQQAEKALRESEARYRTLFDGVPTGLYRTTPEGKILDANLALVEMLGLESREVLLATNTAVFFEDAEDREQWQALMEKEGSVRGFELRMRRSDGTLIWVREHAQAVREPDGRVRYYDGNLEDITERKMLEIQLHEAQKMRTVGQLAGGIAHNYNNILTVIQGNTELVLMAVREDERLSHGLNEVLKASKRAARLTARLLTFGQQEQTEFILLDLNTVIHNVLEKLNGLIGEQISLFTDLEPRLSTIEEDAGNIERIIENLVVNAREAMPEGGEITIATENVRVDRKYCAAHPEAQSGRFVCLSVRDTGVGMSKDNLGRIFEPFFSTKDFSEGAGLGLSVVYGIVRPHGGWIAVESAPGEGATFKVYLPAVSVNSKEEDLEVSVPSETFRGRGERILVVEDEEFILNFSTEVLSENGYVVFAATTAQEALDLFDKEEGSFDLLFCDVVLPDGRGPELVEQLLERRPGINVLFTSGYNDERSDLGAIQEKGIPVLQKPYLLSDLLRAVNEVMKKH